MINLTFTKHCLKRMKSRHITLKEIITSLRYGTVSNAGDNCCRYDLIDIRVIVNNVSMKLITVFRLSDEKLIEKNTCRKKANKFRLKRENLYREEALIEISHAL